MSNSTPADPARADAAAYVKRLLDLLGDRDPLAVQARLLESLKQAIDGVEDASLRRREADGKWSIIEVVQHLADIEAVYVYRYRAILAENQPEIQGFDQDAWAEALRYRDADLDAAFAQIRVLREANLRLLRSLTDEQFKRVGRHTERGEESVRRTAELVAAHDLVHLAQIERVRRRISDF